MEERNITMPVVALRGLTVLPGMTIHFDVSREKSVKAVEKAMVGDQKVFLTAQKDPEIEDPTVDQLCPIGTVSMVKQLEGRSKSFRNCSPGSTVSPTLTESTYPALSRERMRIFKVSPDSFRSGQAVLHFSRISCGARTVRFKKSSDPMSLLLSTLVR